MDTAAWYVYIVEMMGSIAAESRTRLITLYLKTIARILFTSSANWMTDAGFRINMMVPLILHEINCFSIVHAVFLIK